MALFGSLVFGQGQHVDCSVVEANSDLLDRWGIDSTLGKLKQPRTSLAHHGGYPNQIYPCRGGYLVLRIEPPGWGALADMVGDDSLRKTEYAGPNRKQYHDEIDPTLVDWLEDLGEVGVFKEAQEKFLSSGYLMTPEDMVASPQLKERDFFHEIDHPSTDRVKYPGAPFRLSDTEWVQSQAPLLGEHNYQVYTGHLGLTNENLIGLFREGVI